jgi:hypothetical protein
VTSAGSDLLERRLARIGRANETVEIITVQVTDVDSAGLVTVDLGGNDRRAARMLDTPLAIGDNVLAVRQGLRLTILGPLDVAARPVNGTVASAPSNSFQIIVNTTLGALGCQFLGSYTPVVGDKVLIMWSGSTPIVIGEQGKTGTPPTPTPPPPPRPPTPTPPPKPPTIKRGTKIIQAVSCGSYRSGQWRDDAAGNVIQGTAPGYPGLNSGAWFYAGKVHANLAGATVTGAWIWLSRVSGGAFAAQTVHLFRELDDRHPTGNTAPSFGALNADVALAVGQSGWFRLPLDFAQGLVDLGGSVGVKAPSGPYVRLAGLAQTGRAGSLKISWRK